MRDVISDATERDTAQLLAAGNYTAAALTGSPDEWETYAALGLIGRTLTALDGLGRFDRPEARFYAAVASWIGGDEAAAERGLKGLELPHARNLLTLIRKPRIRVLAQLPWFRSGPLDLLTGAQRDAKFHVQNISFDPRDLPSAPYADVTRYYDATRPPDFYVCQMVEWHLIPPNLQQLPCPLLGQTSDYELQIQTVYPRLQIFDELLVNEHTEWEDVRGLTGLPVATFPKTFGVADSLPAVPARTRRTDVCFTGTIIDPYQSDKARLVQQVLQMPGITCKLVNGFIPPREYLSLLANTKVSFTYVRRSTGMPTRGLETLSMGCALIVQAESVLRLFVGEDEGVFTYRFDAGDLSDVVRRLLSDWPSVEQRARRGSATIRREFALSTVASQYLRFLTFLAARPRPTARRVVQAPLDQRRPMMRYGVLPGGPEVMQRIADANTQHWRNQLAEELNPHAANLLAREVILDMATDETPMALLGRGRVVDRVLSMMGQTARQFPDALVLRFNLIRTALHFGRPRQVSAALTLAAEILERPASAWAVSLDDDVFPVDFCKTHFNYRRYLDLVTCAWKDGTDVAGDLVRLIRASLHHYLGCYGDDAVQYRRAAALDPDFPYYRLSLARTLVQGETPGGAAEAVPMLLDLAENSMVFLEAALLLESLGDHPACEPSRRAGIIQRIARAEERLCLVDYPRAAALQPALASVTPPTREASPKPCEPSPVAEPEYLVSALVSTYNAERFLRGCLEDLQRQTMQDRLEIVVIDSGSTQREAAIVDEFKQRCGNLVYLRTERENSHVALNRAIGLARGQYLTIANTDDRHRPDAFERMVAVLESRQDIALVYADCAITDQENATLEDGRILGHLRPPDFDRRLLFRGCFVGPQPMWRKAVHVRCGRFDPEFPTVGDYELWLRMAATETFAHIPETLGLYLMTPAGNERVNGIRRHQETERARRKHWPKEWGELPPWDADYNVVLECPTGGRPVAAGSHASRTAMPESSPLAGRKEDLASALEAAAQQLAGRRWTAAVDGFRRVLEMAPDLAEARAALGSALLVLGRTEEAILELRQAAERLNTSETWNNLGWAEATACHPEAARAALIKAIQCDPKNLEPQRNLAALFETLGMAPEATAAYDLVLLTAPGDGQARAGKARCAVPSPETPATAERGLVGVPPCV